MIRSLCSLVAVACATSLFSTRTAHAQSAGALSRVGIGDWRYTIDLTLAATLSTNTISMALR